VMLQSKANVKGNLFHQSLSIEQGAHFEGESHPSEDPLASHPDVAAEEPQLNHNGRPDAVKQRERGNGFIKSLPESPSA
jgi:cytoskeletal protein CcmA (bactofilin family)